MATETLRVAIETALRRRDPEAEVCVGAAPAGFHGRDAMAMTAHGIARVRGDDEASALRTLARLVGLRDDGSDPAADVERLTRALHDAARRLGCADYDDVCAAVSDALDEAEARDREAVDEANALRRERDEARTALARRDAEYLALAQRSDARGFELRAAKTDAHKAHGDLATLSAAVRRERDTRAAWLDSLPDGSCGNPPPAALIEAEDATGEALRALEGGR